MNAARDSFELLFQVSDDPWKFRTRWYEARKRELVLACLPAARYGQGYEPGCANGELAAALATRCDRLLASDGIAAAVALATHRLQPFSHVDVVQAWMPKDWPSLQFDLVVLSEFGFYLSRDELRTMALGVRHSLGAHGTLLACHWRHPVEGFALDGDAVHRTLHQRLGLPRLLHHEERDLVIDVWCADERSVAQVEGFV